VLVADLPGVANVSCTSTLPAGVAWNQGSAYSTKLLPTNVYGRYLKAEWTAPGVIGYTYVSTFNPVPAPVVVPSSIIDKFGYLMRRLRGNFSNADNIMSEFLRDTANADLVNYIKTAAIGAGVAIVVGTILEDIITAGAGIADDWTCFVLAYRIIRFGIKL
jgi:hypothetical protein